MTLTYPFTIIAFSTLPTFVRSFEHRTSSFLFVHSLIKKIAKMITRAKRRRVEQGDQEQWPEPEVPEHNARVKRIKTELNALRVDDLRKELGLWSRPEAGRKRDLVDRLVPHRLQLQGSPFDLLPDELVLKIVKTATQNSDSGFNRYDYGYDYDFIMYNLCTVSARFNRIARDPSLWEDCTELRLDLHVEILGRVTKWFLHAGMTDITIGGDYFVVAKLPNWNYPAITGDHIAAIATKCPDLKRFEVGKVNIETWPAICMPALEELSMVSPGCGSAMFKNMQLHLVLPRLKVFRVHLRDYQRMWLPDLTKSFQLREVFLRGGTFHVQKYLEGKVLFPRTLEKLSCNYDLTNQQDFEDSDCELLGM